MVDKTLGWWLPMVDLKRSVGGFRWLIKCSGGGFRWVIKSAEEAEEPTE